MDSNTSFSNVVPTATKSTSTFDNITSNTGFSNSEQKSKLSTPNVVIKDDPNILAPYICLVHDLVHWENPVLSGLVLNGSVLSILLTHFFMNSFLSITCGVLFTITLLNLLYVGTARLIQSLSGSVARNPNRQRIENAYFEWTEQDAIHFSNIFLTLLNSVAGPFVRFVFVHDFGSSIKALVTLYATWSVVSYIPTTYFLILSLITLFSAPLAYHRNKEQIHSFKIFVETKAHKNFVQFCTFTNKVRAAMFEKVKHSKSTFSTNSMNIKKEE